MRVQWFDSRLKYNNLKQQEDLNVLTPGQHDTIWSPQADWSPLIGPDQPRYWDLIGGHWTPHYAAAKVFAITTNLKANKIHLCVFGCLLVCC